MQVSTRGSSIVFWRNNSIERISRGLYRRTDLLPVDLDLTEIAGRRPDATICLSSALARHELIAQSLPRATGPLRIALEILT